ncbi:hypothetical protein COS75_01300 [Candidatus Pacearchaeota archaeon CG06_land_8_20_14_3_00_35_12]|nr:MAG: hypothetical protein COS75_01300 [Candidatus Pacearchaeota archaeon CG06_land_8_20_14_3_00_35_12]
MIEFNKRILKNGITLLSEERNQPLVAIFAAIKQGAANEKAQEKGITHFLEHMIFRNTKKRTSQEIDEIIEKTGGSRNGSTEQDLTTFYVKLPSKYLELGIEVISEMIQNPSFSLEDIEKERKIIFEEIKMQHDLPQLYVLKKLINLLYASPFGAPMIGNIETLNRINKETLEARHLSYMPKNLIISVVGNASIKEAEEIINKKFVFKNNNAVLFQPHINKISAESIEKRPNIDQAQIAFGFHMPTAIEKSRYSAEIFDSILIQGMSSRLYQEVREKRGLAYHIDGLYDSGTRYGMEIIYAGTSPDKVKLIKSLILKEINSLKTISKKELAETKEKLIGSFELSREKSEIVAKELIYEEIANGAEEYYNYIKRISEVDLEEVRKIPRQIKKYSFSALLPK